MSESKQTLAETGYSRRWVIILTHVAVWAIVLALPYLLNSRHDDSRPQQARPYDRQLFYLGLLMNFLWFAPFYLNAYVLTPRLFFRKKYVAYVASLGLLFSAVMAMDAFLFIVVLGIPSSRYSLLRGTLFHGSTFLLVIAISTVYRLVKDRMAADKAAQQKQEENLKTELAFLRSQINPHFIFNILNNLVALERMKSPELGPTILKLSSLMQYMLYETDEDKVPLSMEVEYLQSYIDLQRQRFGEKVPICVSLKTPPEDGFYEIEPMLLIPFVENAFKHGVGLIEQPAIYIDLHVQAGVLFFQVKNKYNADSSEVKDKGSGIGLANVRRRLNLLYGRQQKLNINRDQDWFTVSLELNLH
ncbi:MAG TPA: histidine kinase [Puia sp.]|nr:histidine kinase [Puia sp.]